MVIGTEIILERTKKMKKIICVLLSALLLCSFAAFAAAAAGDGVTGAYTVTVAEDSAGKFKIVPIVDGEEVAEGKVYVKEGDSFRFKIEYLSEFSPDQTTRFRAFPAKTYYPDVVQDSVDPQYGVLLEPDADGVYTLDSVTEDIVIEAYNLNGGSFPWLKDFLLDMFNFFKRLMQWFFGLRSN